MIIKKGRHSYLHLPCLHVGDSIERTFKFNSPIDHDLGYPDQLDWNKLFGVAFFPAKHTNSYRIVWRYIPTTKQIELGAYCYQKGKLIKDLSLGFISPDHSYTASISSQGDYVYFDLFNDGSLLSSVSVKGKWQQIGWQLFPFFGGNKTAPIDISITLSR